MSKKIKIAYLDYSPVFAGAERVLYTIINNLDRSKYEPYMVFPFPREFHRRYETLDCEKHYLSPKLTWWHGSEYWKHPLRGTDMLKRFIFGRRLAKYLNDNGISILHVNLLRPDCYFWIKPCHDAGIKVIGHYRSQDYEWVSGPKVQRCCDLILCVSKFSRSHFISKGIFTESRVLYDSIDTGTLQCSLSKQEAKHKLGFPIDCILLSSVGQLSRHKGHDNAIRAFAKIMERYPNALLYIAGGGDSQYLKDIAQELNVSNKVILSERQVSNIQEVYRASDIILSLTKVGEGFGLVPFESSYIGTPFVAPEFGAITEFVDGDGKNLLVDTNDVNKIVERIEWILTHHTEAESIVAQIQQLIKERIVPSVMVNNLSKVYDELSLKN